VADARLEIAVIDDGVSPVGEPAPEPASFIPPQQPTAPSPAPSAPTVPEPGSREKPIPDHAPSLPDITSAADGLKSLAQTLGYGGLVSVVETLTVAFRELAAASRVKTELPAPQPESVPSVPQAAGPEDQAAEAPSPGKPKRRRPGRNEPAEPIPNEPLPPPEPSKPVSLPKAPKVTPGDVPTDAIVLAESESVAGALGGVAAAAGPVALAFAGVAAAGGLAIAAIKKVSDVLEEQAFYLAKYSGALAASSAQADIRQQQAEISRANQLGPLLASFQNDYSRGQTALYDLGTQLLKVVLEAYQIVRPFAETGIKLLEVTAAGTEIQVDGLRSLVHLLSGQFGAVRQDWAAIDKSLQKILDIIQGAQANGDDPLLDQFNRDFVEAIAGPIENIRKAHPWNPRPLAP